MFPLQSRQQLDQRRAGRTFLVEIKRVDRLTPHLCRSDTVHVDDPLEIPFGIVATQFDLQMSELVFLDPLSQMLWQTVADGLGHTRCRQWIQAADQMKKGKSFHRHLPYDLPHSE